MSTCLVIDGEVIETHRTRKRNDKRLALREPVILPPDVDTKVVSLRQLDRADQEQHVTALLIQSRAGLAAATDAHQAVEWKAKAGAIQELAKQLQLSREIQLDAAEFTRRAERAVGIAIREGQSNGTVETSSEARARGAHAREVKAGRRSISSEEIDRKIRVSSLLTPTEQSGGSSGQHSVFKLADGVSDPHFEKAIAEARAEGNLSRANVARKAQALAARRAVAHETPIPPTPRPKLEPRSRLTKHDSTEMLANINGMLNGIVETLPFIDPADIDAESNRAVINNIRHAMGKLRSLLKGIENG